MRITSKRPKSPKQNQSHKIPGLTASKLTTITVKKQQQKIIHLEQCDVQKILEEADRLIKTNEILQAINLLRALKESSVKLKNTDQLIIIVVNLGIAYYQVGFLEEAYEQFKLASNKLKQSSIKMLPFRQKDNLRIRQQTLYGKIQLQTCILFSQMGKHQDALKHAKQACKINFNLIFDIFYVIIFELISFLDEAKTKRRGANAELNFDQQMKQLGNNLAIISHLMNLIQDLSPIFLVKQKGRILQQAKKELNKFWTISKKLDIDLLFKQSQQSQIGELDWIYQNKILDQIQLKPVLSSSLKISTLITNAQIVQKITFLAISLYCYSTQVRFTQKNKQNLNQHDVLDSQHWLSRSLQIAYMFMPPQAPILNQILTVHDRFHGLDKQTIPQDKEVSGFFKVLRPLIKPNSLYNSKNHLGSPVMIRIQAPKLVIDIFQDEQKQVHSCDKINELDNHKKKIFDFESLTKNNKIKGLNFGNKVVQFNDFVNNNPPQNRIKPSSRHTISNLSSLQVQKYQINKNSTARGIYTKKQSVRNKQQKLRINMSQLNGKALISQDLLLRPHSYDKQINKLQKIQESNKINTERRRKSMPNKHKEKQYQKKVVYNGSIKLDGIKLTGRKLDQNFQTSFFQKLAKAHNNEQKFIENAEKIGGNIYINNNINLFISSKGITSQSENNIRSQTHRQNQKGSDLSKRQKFINKRRFSNFTLCPQEF